MSSSVVEQMIVLFGFVFLGHIANRAKVLNQNANACFSGFLLKVALPATILNSAFGQATLKKSNFTGCSYGSSCFCYYSNTQQNISQIV